MVPSCTQENSLRAIVGFEDAEVYLDTFSLKRPLVPLAVVLDNLRDHYQQQVLRQAYKIVFAVDFLGNPIGVVQNLTTGLQSFVTESVSGNMLQGGTVCT